MTSYRSKVDIWLAALVFGVFTYTAWKSLSQQHYNALWLLIPVTLFVASLYWQIKYTIHDEYLQVHSGLFGNTKVGIKDIKSLHKTNNPLSAPALSINRLEIKYGNNFNYLLISPQDRDDFIKQLSTINPNIDIRI